jgi:membrane protease YdiL (CAAX protease family)
MENKKGIAAYLIIAFGLAWIIWGITVLAGLRPDDPKFIFVLAPGGFAPAIAAFVVRKWVTREGFADAGLRPNLGRWPYYLFAWLWPLAVVVVIVLLAAVLGLSDPDFTFNRALAKIIPQGTAVPEIRPAIVLIPMLLSALFYTPILFGEEFGWRGYLQIRLFADRPTLAAVATGLIWAVWHYPLLLMGYQFPDNRYAGLVVFPVSLVLYSIMLGWLRLRTDSVWAPSLAHSAFNVVGASLTMLLFLGGSNYLFVFFSGILGWIPMAILCVWILMRHRLQPWHRALSSSSGPLAPSRYEQQGVAQSAN